MPVKASQHKRVSKEKVKKYFERAKKLESSERYEKGKEI